MPVSAYQYGIEIPQNADMNTYKTPGKFVSVSSSVTSTLENSPFSNGGFRLEVRSMIDQNNGASIQQIAYPGNMNAFKQFAIRTFLNTAWDDWRYFSDDTTFLSYHGSTTASDLNEIRSIGAYWINPSVTTENHPSNTFGILEVIGGMQRFTEYDKQRRIFVRYYVNSQWTSWVSFDHS